MIPGFRRKEFLAQAGIQVDLRDADDEFSSGSVIFRLHWDMFVEISRC